MEFDFETYTHVAKMKDRNLSGSSQVKEFSDRIESALETMNLYKNARSNAKHENLGDVFHRTGNVRELKNFSYADETHIEDTIKVLEAVRTLVSKPTNTLKFIDVYKAALRSGYEEDQNAESAVDMAAAYFEKTLGQQKGVTIT